MIHDVHKCIKTDLSESKILMPVLGSSRLVLTVVHMEHRNLILADKFIELLHHAIKIMYDVITGITGMTGIKAYPKLIIATYTIVYLCQFLKASADLTAFSCHRFKRDIAFCIRCQNFIQSLYDAGNSNIHTRSHM